MLGLSSMITLLAHRQVTAAMSVVRQVAWYQHQVGEACLRIGEVQPGQGAQDRPRHREEVSQTQFGLQYRCRDTLPGNHY